LYPADLKYTPEHEWVRESGEQAGSVRIGITSYAQEALGDIVYVQLPEAGSTVESGAAIGELESTKSVSDIYAPVGGTVVARNDNLEQAPDLINSDPYGEGWLLEIEPADSDGLANLLDAETYREQVESS
jgi:glycine cleavage system H protein